MSEICVSSGRIAQTNGRRKVLSTGGYENDGGVPGDQAPEHSLTRVSCMHNCLRLSAGVKEIDQKTPSACKYILYISEDIPIVQAVVNGLAVAEFLCQ